MRSYSDRKQEIIVRAQQQARDGKPVPLRPKEAPKSSGKTAFLGKVVHIDDKVYEELVRLAEEYGYNLQFVPLNDVLRRVLGMKTNFSITRRLANIEDMQ